MAATLTSSIAAGSQSRVSLQLHERINPASVNINLMGELRREEDGMRLEACLNGLSNIHICDLGLPRDLARTAYKRSNLVDLQMRVNTDLLSK